MGFRGAFGEDGERPARERRSSGWFPKLIIIGVVALFAIILISGAVVIIPAGSRGVVLTWGQVTGNVGSGLVWKTPIAQEIQLMDVRVLKAERNDESAGTGDLQEVTVDVAVNYQIDPNLADVIYRNIGRGYQSTVIEPNIDESLKSVTAKFTAEALITNRDFVKSQLKDELQGRLTQYGITVLSVSFTDFKFSKKFNDAIEAKVTAQQQALEAQNNLLRVQYEQQQKIITAQAEANATVTKATADGRAVVIAAQAKAEAILLLQEQLKGNPDYLQYQSILQWNGVLPYYLGGGAVIPFLNISGTNSTTPN